MSRASRSLPAALGLALALGGLCAPPPAAAAATTTRTWDETMAYRVATAQQPRPGVITFAAPGPRAALGERLVGSAQRIGGAPTSVPAGAVDATCHGLAATITGSA